MPGTSRPTVSVIVGGKWNAFQLAAQLQRHQMLGKLITSYPTSRVRDVALDSARVASYGYLDYLLAAWSRAPVLRKIEKAQLWKAVALDLLASRALPDTDILVAWAGFGLHSLQRAKQAGTIAVVERSSCHAVFQHEVLSEEHERLGIPAGGMHEPLLERELQEYDLADFIMVPSRFARQTFIDRGMPGAKILQVPFGVDSRRFRRTPKEDKVFRVLYLGGIRVGKGVHYLLEAASGLRLRNLEVAVAGRFDSSGIERFLGRYEGEYRFLGHIPDHLMSRVYSQASVFVIPSLQEGLAMVIGEAMACGLPVIATPNSGAEELVRDGVDGFIVPIRDVERLRERILQLYENEALRQTMADSAWRRVQEFTWDHYGDKVASVYTEIHQRRAETAG